MSYPQQNKNGYEGLHRQIRKNKWEKEIGNQGKCTHEEIIKKGISSECLSINNVPNSRNTSKMCK